MKYNRNSRRINKSLFSSKKKSFFSSKKKLNFGYTGSLKETPIFEGYAKSDLSSCVPKSMTPQVLENILKKSQFSTKKLKKKIKKSVKKTIDKTIDKTIKKSVKKRVKKSVKKTVNKLLNQSKKSKKSSFGNALESLTRLGLPDGQISPKSIDQALYSGLGNPLLKQSIINRPYDNADQYNMTMLGFGKVPNSSQNSTPGSTQWIEQANTPQAKDPSFIELYSKSLPNEMCNILKPLEHPWINVPRNYSNNILNQQISFGKNKKPIPKKPIPKKPIPKKSIPKKPILNSVPKKPIKHSFGAMSTTSAMYGPNNVGHETFSQLYKGGSNTINFATGKPFINDIIKGPTNSTGEYASAGTTSNQLLGVVPDGRTPNAYLSTSTVEGLNQSLPKFGFGNKMVYNALRETGSGVATIMGPVPDYLKDNSVNGSFANYGKKSSKSLDKKPLDKKPSKPLDKKPLDKKPLDKKPSKPLDKKSLQNLFGEKVITLNKTGVISVTNEPKTVV